MNSSISVPIQVRGRLRVQKFRGDRCTYDGPWQSNIFVGAGLDMAFQQPSTFSWVWLQVGSGSTPPAVGQTALDAPLGSPLYRADRTVEDRPAFPPWLSTQTLVFLGEEGAVVGNVAEVGIRAGIANPNNPPTSAHPLCTRALLRDEGGNPTTITVLADEFLRVEYTLEHAAISGSGTWTVNTPDGPLNIGYTIHPEGVRYGSGVSAGGWRWDDRTFYLRPRTNLVSGNPGEQRRQFCAVFEANTAPPAPTDVFPPETMAEDRLDLHAVGAYDPGSFSRTYTLRARVGAGNYPTGIGALRLDIGGGVGNNRQQYLVTLDQQIPKTAEQVLDIPITLSIANAPAEEP